MSAERSDPAYIGRYRIRETLFVSSSTEVMRCRDPVIDRPVVIKRWSNALHGEDPQAAERLWLEGQVRASLDHPHVLPLFDADRSEHEVYLVGPFVLGEPLTLRFDDQTLPPSMLLRVITAMGAVVDALGAIGWVHGDLHGRNILLTHEDRPVLIDFASARLTGERWCRPGQPARLKVTPQIIAPEIWRGEPVDHRSDLYSLGALIFRSFNGRYPFDHEDPRRIPEMHCRHPVPPLEPKIPLGSASKGIQRVIQRALAKDAADRFASGAELAAALEDAVARMPSASPSSAPRRHLSKPQQTPDGPSSQLREDRDDLQAQPELASLTTQLFGVPATLVALEEIGAAAAMAEGASTLPEIARRCGAPETTVRRLLEVACQAGFAGRRDDSFQLPPPLVRAYREDPGNRRSRPLRRALRFWSSLPRWARTEHPFLRMDEQDGERYSKVVGVLGELFDRRATALAEILRAQGALPRGAAILDVGAGSGVWSGALAVGDPTSRITAVDRPAVLEELNRRARENDLEDQVQGVAGDWRDVSLPTDTFDVALLANLCHLEAAEDVARLLTKVAATIRPGGRLVVVDSIPEDRRTAPVELLLYGLRMGLRTSRGDLHDLRSFHSWLSDAGLEFEDLTPLDPAAGTLAALIARRPEADRPAASPDRPAGGWVS